MKSVLINEQQVLACLLKEPLLINDEEKNFFVSPISICIFDALKKLSINNISLNTSTIVSECARTNNEITHSLIDDIKNKVQFDINDFSFYKQRLIEDYVKELLQKKVLKTATSNLMSNGKLDVEALKQTIIDIQNGLCLIESKNLSLKNLQEALDEYEKNLLTRNESISFMSTGNSFLDSKLAGGGIPIGQFITLFSGPGMGKTSFVTNLINGNINKRTPTLFIPLEMGMSLMMDKIISLRTQIHLNKFYEKDFETGSVSEFVFNAFKEEKEKLIKNKHFIIADVSTLSLKSLHTLIKDAKKQMGVKSLQVVIDLFTQLTDIRGENKASSIQDACDTFFDILKEEKCTGIAVVQSRRKQDVHVSNYEDCLKYQPLIEDIKGSQAFEERSRAIISIFRQKHIGIRTLGEEDPEVVLADDIMMIKILKQNLASLATLHFLFDGSTGKIWKLEEEN